MRYYPESAPVGASPEDIIRWAAEEFDRIRLSTDGLYDGNVLYERNVAPLMAPPYGLYLADGTNWDPGQGRQLYYYDEEAGRYIPLAQHSVLQHQGIGDDSTDNKAAFEAAAAEGPFVVPEGVYRFTQNTTISQMMIFEPGAVLKPDAGVVITINKAQPDWLPQKIFDGSGTVEFGSGSVPWTRPEWWGAVGDGVTADHVAINACATATRTIPSANQRQMQLIGSAKYKCSDTLTFSGVGVPLNFSVEGNGATFFFEDMPDKHAGIEVISSQHGCSFRNFFLEGGANNPPWIGLLLARNSSGQNSAISLFSNISMWGYFDLVCAYLSASESSTFEHCWFANNIGIGCLFSGRANVYGATGSGASLQTASNSSKNNTWINPNFNYRRGGVVPLNVTITNAAGNINVAMTDGYRHHHAVGDKIQLASTNHNGDFTVASVVDDWNFTVADTYVANDSGTLKGAPRAAFLLHFDEVSDYRFIGGTYNSSPLGTLRTSETAPGEHAMVRVTSNSGVASINVSFLGPEWHDLPGVFEPAVIEITHSFDTLYNWVITGGNLGGWIKATGTNLTLNGWKVQVDGIDIGTNKMHGPNLLCLGGNDGRMEMDHFQGVCIAHEDIDFVFGNDALCEGLFTRGNLPPVLTPFTATETEFLDGTSDVNTFLKERGAPRYDSTNLKPLWGGGNTQTAVWRDATGALVFTPVVGPATVVCDDLTFGTSKSAATLSTGSEVSVVAADMAHGMSVDSPTPTLEPGAVSAADVTHGLSIDSPTLTVGGGNVSAADVTFGVSVDSPTVVLEAAGVTADNVTFGMSIDSPTPTIGQGSVVAADITFGKSIDSPTLTLNAASVAAADYTHGVSIDSPTISLPAATVATADYTHGLSIDSPAPSLPAAAVSAADVTVGISESVPTPTIGGSSPWTLKSTTLANKIIAMIVSDPNDSDTVKDLVTANSITVHTNVATGAAAGAFKAASADANYFTLGNAGDQAIEWTAGGRPSIPMGDTGDGFWWVLIFDEWIGQTGEDYVLVSTADGTSSDEFRLKKDVNSDQNVRTYVDGSHFGRHGTTWPTSTQFCIAGKAIRGEDPSTNGRYYYGLETATNLSDDNAGTNSAITKGSDVYEMQYFGGQTTVGGISARVQTLILLDNTATLSDIEELFDEWTKVVNT